MKLLIQSDDYGISKAQALGCLEAIRFGLLKNTGIFVNMPWFEECAELIKPYIGHIDLGIDLNVSTGSPILNSKIIPSLVQKNGAFLTSSMNRALDNESNNFDHVNYDETYKEMDSQIQKYINYFDRLPDYLQGHAFETDTTKKVIKDLGNKYGIKDTNSICEKYSMIESAYWYNQPITYDNQFKSSLKEYILQDKEHLLEKEIACIVCHCGYVDRDLMDLSSYNIYRLNDLYALTDNEVKDWIITNNVELVTYKDI